MPITRQPTVNGTPPRVNKRHLAANLVFDPRVLEQFAYA
jgi:hypothetical protein